MAYLDEAAGSAREAAGVPLTATAAGRARMADGFFNAATALLKFAARSIDRSLLALRAVTAKTANYTVLTTDSGNALTTVGASGTVTFSLPAAVVGLEYLFRVGAAQECRLDPNGSETIALPSTGVQGGAGKYLVADADGETVHLLCTKAGQWSVLGFTGTWTSEA